jgi:hypothetical protein
MSQTALEHGGIFGALSGLSLLPAQPQDALIGVKTTIEIMSESFIWGLSLRFEEDVFDLFETQHHTSPLYCDTILPYVWDTDLPRDGMLWLR